jgi:hypothetical protein
MASADIGIQPITGGIPARARSAVMADGTVSHAEIL